MIVPRDTYVLIRPNKEKPISTFLALPDALQAKDKPIGTVLAVGPKCSLVDPGDTVYYEQFDWSRATDDAIILQECEILAKVLDK